MVFGEYERAVKRCANHPRREALTRCASCRRPLCGDCWLRDVDGDPWCERCIFYLTSRGGNLALAVAFFLTVASVGWMGLKWKLPFESTALWGWSIVGAIPLSVFIAVQRAPAGSRDIKPREPDRAPPPPGPRARGGHPYRAALRRASRIVASPVSGVKTAALLGLSMALLALSLPKAFDLPRVVELELVVFGWWLMWGATGSVLLYRGFRVADDHVLRRPRPPWFLGAKNLWEEQTVADRSCLGCSGALPIVPFALLLVAFAIAWLMVEVVLPALFFLVYISVRAGLAAVANDEHDCEGHLPRALFWGFIWSSVFVFPLAGTLAMVHVLGFG